MITTPTRSTQYAVRSTQYAERSTQNYNLKSIIYQNNFPFLTLFPAQIQEAHHA